MAMRRLYRREFLVAASAAAAASLLAACGGGNSQEVVLPTKTPAASGSAPATTGQSAASSPAVVGQASPAAAPAGVPQVPRNQTLIMSVSDSVDQMNDSEIHNPFLPTAQRTGWHIAFEPLYFYDSVWNEKASAPPGLTGSKGEIPLPSGEVRINPDFTELTIKLRPGITWSDGMPFTSSDVVFTINMLRDNGAIASTLNFAFDMRNAVKDIVAIDPLTVKFTLNSPNPNFMIQYFQWVQDQGIPIVPEHIFKGQPDLKTFTNHDISKGWPVVTGPWKLVFSSPTQKIWDRRDDWWGAKTGFHPLPAVKRVIILPRYEDPKLTDLAAAGEIECLPQPPTGGQQDRPRGEPENGSLHDGEEVALRRSTGGRTASKSTAGSRPTTTPRSAGRSITPSTVSRSSMSASRVPASTRCCHSPPIR